MLANSPGAHEQFTLHHGDSLEVLKTLPDNSVDAIVCDPPAGIGFMGRDWDSNKGGRDAWIAWLSSIMKEGLRVLKPGGHALVWALPRTSHWTGMAVEDAGFELRERISHLFGSGFPKSMCVSKAIDKAAGAEREVVGRAVYGDGHVQNSAESMGYGGCDPDSDRRLLTAPATEAARQWQGWGTALKPAMEDWWLARKPLSEKTVAANVLQHGTGALNIDGCRVAGEAIKTTRGTALGRMSDDTWKADAMRGEQFESHPAGRWPANLITDGSEEVLAGFPQSVARPAAAVLRGEVSGDGGGDGNAYGAGMNKGARTGYADSEKSAARFFKQVSHDDEDLATIQRFMYCAKASKRDRNSGLDSSTEVIIEWSQSLESSTWENEARKVRLLVDTEQSPPRVTGAFGAQNNDATAWSTLLFGSGTTGQSQQGSMCTTKTKTGCTTTSEILSFCRSSITSASTQDALLEMASHGSHAENVDLSTLSITTTNELMASALGAEHVALPMRLKISASAAKSGHPTVKPVELMSWLVRLVTPPNGLVLDPFMGSGSTGKAAMLEGFRFIGIEREAEYIAIARARIEAAHRHACEGAARAQEPIAQPELFGKLA